jgi:predicted RNA methylase
MKITDDVLTVLSGLTFEGPHARIEAQLDRKLYEKVNKALEACGGKWNRKAKAHVFDTDAAELVDRVIVAGEFTTARDTGFFPTPVALATKLVRIAEIEDGNTVLEPSAGTGRLVEAALAVGPKVQVWACERDEPMRNKLKALVGPRGLWHQLYVLGADDFMDVSAKTGTGTFDRVVMNPPFVKGPKGDHLDHVRHAYTLLNKGGILAAILPSGVRFREDKRHREFRDWIADKGGDTVDLPADSFKESGTSVNTCIVKVGR